MRKTLFAVASLLLMVLHSPLARAQEALPPPIVFVTSFLQLSPEQTAALINMIQTRDAALQPIAADLRGKHEALGKLVESPNPDAAAIGRLILEIRTVEKQAGAIARDSAAKFVEILTPEQRQRVEAVTQAAQIEPAIQVLRAVGLL